MSKYIKFDIGTVLSVVYGKLLTDVSNVYEMLNYILDENLFSHQLPRAMRFVKGFILAQHPQLKKWEKENEQITCENWKKYLKLAEKRFGKYLEIKKIPQGLWLRKNPVEEAIEIF